MKDLKVVSDDDPIGFVMAHNSFSIYGKPIEETGRNSTIGGIWFLVSGAVEEMSKDAKFQS